MLVWHTPGKMFAFVYVSITQFLHSVIFETLLKPFNDGSLIVIRQFERNFGIVNVQIMPVKAYVEVFSVIGPLFYLFYQSIATESAVALVCDQYKVAF